MKKSIFPERRIFLAILKNAFSETLLHILKIVLNSS